MWEKYSVFETLPYNHINLVSYLPFIGLEERCLQLEIWCQWQQCRHGKIMSIHKLLHVVVQIFTNCCLVCLGYLMVSLIEDIRSLIRTLYHALNFVFFFASQ